jgi:hypothetical protein
LFITRVQVFPEVPPEQGGGFTPSSFDHLMHLQVHQPGLDPTWEHTLVAAHVEPDRTSAELTLHSTPGPALSLDRHLRIVTWQPAAHVRGHDTDGNVIVETKLDAPLHPGQVVEVGGKPHRVAPAEDHELWPLRHPETGICRGDLDWQHVTLVPEPQPPHHPQLKDGAP